MVRRKSDEVRTAIDCKYHRSAMHERNNQNIHEQRMVDDPAHEQYSACWCCCIDCKDLTWYHEEPPSLITPSGVLRPAWGPSGASPGSAEINESL